MALVFFLAFDVCNLHQERHSLDIVDVLHHKHTEVLLATENPEKGVKLHTLTFLDRQTSQAFWFRVLSADGVVLRG